MANEGHLQFLGLVDDLRKIVDERKLDDKEFSISSATFFQTISLLIQQSTADMEIFSALIALASGKNPTAEFDEILQTLEQNQKTLQELLKRVMADLEITDV
ncbi:MAG: hypothetical protein CML23_11555 [Rhizobiaceae bacterium]|nr:hypothetical protein [Rhizobiaceae bacterium]|tara:strand:+ start:86 stop:391 length:306 start_codon:yes stop_codon:yes gene_type:complete